MNRLESELLDAAADCIERLGWTQGRMRDECGVCLWGAIRTASEALNECSVIARFLEYRVVHRLSAMATGYLALAAWNDEPDRTKQQVLDLLRKAAKEAREDEERR